MIVALLATVGVVRKKASGCQSRRYEFELKLDKFQWSIRGAIVGSPLSLTGLSAGFQKDLTHPSSDY